MSDTIFDTLIAQTALLRDGEIIAGISRLSSKSDEHVIVISTDLQPVPRRQYKDQAMYVLTELEKEHWKSYDRAYRAVCAFFDLFPVPDNWRQLANSTLPPSPMEGIPRIEGLEGFTLDDDFWGDIDSLLRP